MTRIKLSSETATQIELLESIRKGDWISILLEIGASPHEFFEGGVWIGEDFSNSCMRRISFRNAILDGAIFRQEDRPFIDLSVARSCVDVNFVSTEMMVSLSSGVDLDLPGIHKRLSGAVPADEKEKYIPPDSYSASATPICNSMANRSSGFIEAMRIYQKAQEGGSVPFQLDLNSYETLLFKSRDLSEALLLLDFFATTKPTPISPSMEIWHRIMAKAETREDAAYVLSLSKAWKGPIRLPDYDMYATPIKLSADFEEAAELFKQSHGAFRVSDYGYSLLSYLEDKIETPMDRAQFVKLINEEPLSERFSNSDRYRALIRMSISRSEALTTFQNMSADKTAYADEGAMIDLISGADSLSELLHLLAECHRLEPYHDPGGPLLAEIASILARVWTEAASWQFIFDYFDSVELLDLQAVLHRTESLVNS